MSKKNKACRSERQHEDLEKFIKKVADTSSIVDLVDVASSENIDDTDNNEQNSSKKKYNFIVNVDVDVSDALKGLKELQQEISDTNKELKSLEETYDDVNNEEEESLSPTKRRTDNFEIAGDMFYIKYTDENGEEYINPVRKKTDDGTGDE